MEIKVNSSKPRKPTSDLWLSKDGTKVFIGKDYALQNEIDEKKKETRARACFRECNTCGACANSRRDNFQHRLLPVTYEKNGKLKVRKPTESYDSNAGEFIDCRACEPFRFHDCHNGVMRDTRQDAEPFTPDVQELIKKSGGKPLI